MNKNNKNQRATLEQLPQEILLYIVDSLLSKDDIKNLSQVSKAYYLKYTNKQNNHKKTLFSSFNRYEPIKRKSHILSYFLLSIITLLVTGALMANMIDDENSKTTTKYIVLNTAFLLFCMLMKSEIRKYSESNKQLIKSREQHNKMSQPLLNEGTKKKLIALFLLSLCTPAIASVPFIPYADFTINTQIDPESQERIPYDLSITSNITGIDHYRLAFITAGRNCTSTWGGIENYSVSKAWGKQLTTKLTENNVGFDISLGGANGVDLSWMCSEEQLIERYQEIINVYRPQGLDFDIENNSAEIDKIMGAVKVIQDSNPNIKISFTLITSPNGLPQFSENIVRKAHAADINFNVNIMAMNYDPQFSGGDMAEHAISAADNLFRLLQSLYPDSSDNEVWRKIEITPMIGINGVPRQTFTLENTDTLRNFASQRNLTALSMWSIGRDHPCPDIEPSPICSGNNTQTKSHEFTERFLRCRNQP